MNMPIKPPKYSTPYWQLVMFKKGRGIAGQICGKDYSFNAAKQVCSKKLNGSWVEMTEDEYIKHSHVVKTLRDQYAAQMDGTTTSVRQNKRRMHSLDATRQANQRGIGS